MVCLLGRCFSCLFHTHIVKRLHWTRLVTGIALHSSISMGFVGSGGMLRLHSIHFTCSGNWRSSSLSWCYREILCVCVCVCVWVAQLCPPLCDPMDCSLPGSSVHGILQARIPEWLAMPFSRGFFWLRDQTWVSHIAGRFFTIWATKEAKRSYTVFSLSFSGWNVHLSYLIQKYCI